MTVQSFEEVSLFQTRFHKVNVEQLIQFIVDSAQHDKKTIVGNVNVRAANFAHELPWYRNFLNRSDLVFCDGFGVLLGSKLLGNCVESCHRMTCPDYIEDLILACEKGGASVFLLAGKPGVTTKAIEKLKAIAPNINIQGHHGYFEKTGAENNAIIEQINHFKPDILYVGFGMPLQEEWIVNNIDHIDAKVFLPLGACLDFYTDTVYRGPRWATDLGMEWLTRFLSEPQRLWKRYILGNPLFFYRILKERCSASDRKPTSARTTSIQE
ncbi:MAG: WecB/TagA/CpsF family glycosyltransferase [Cyanobacteria bacterium J06633_2]